MTKAFSHGKLIWIGEHAVVYGHQAIAIPLFQVGVEVMINDRQSTYLNTPFYEGPLEEMGEDYLSIQTLIKQLNAFFKIETHLTLILHMPLNAGLGASASIASAIVSCYYQHTHTELDKDTHFKWIQLSESIAHGLASGIDAFAMTLKVPFIFKKDTPIIELKTALDAYVLIVYSHVAGHTKEAVSHIKTLRLKNQEMVTSSFESIGNLTKRLIESIELKQHVQIGEVMTSAHHTLKRLGLSHEVIETLIGICLKNKALGAKITGGGLGGCMMAYYKDEFALHQTVSELTRLGYHTYFIQKV